MDLNDLQVDHFYRTKSGTVCKVTDVDQASEEKIVSFVPYQDNRPGEPDEMPATFFTANIDEEVAIDPQGKPMADASAATPV